MYNFAPTAYRNLPIAKDTPQKSNKSFGLLARNGTPKQQVSTNKQPRERVADYVMEIRREREKLKNG